MVMSSSAQIGKAHERFQVGPSGTVHDLPRETPQFFSRAARVKLLGYEPAQQVIGDQRDGLLRRWERTPALLEDPTHNGLNFRPARAIHYGEPYERRGVATGAERLQRGAWQ
jgi:hypothetical protein